MRKIIVSEFVSLDGVMENPTWTFQFFSPEQGQYKYEELLASDALLMGRVTYEGFAAAWPGRTDEQGFADRMNRLPKFVASSTLQQPAWNNAQVLPGDIVAEIARLKAQPGQNILVYGSAQLVQALLLHNLVDEYRIMVFPMVLGGGKRLFADGSTATLKLAATHTFSTGVTVLTYHPTAPTDRPREDGAAIGRIF